MDSSAKIPVGISACLLGLEVRHDKGHKHSRYCTGVLSRYFEFRSLCPEMGAGLSAPRKAMHLAEQGAELRLITTDGRRDHTDLMQDFIIRTMPTLAPLRGYILMAKSPSCGMERIRVYNDDGNVQHRDASGLFAAALQTHYPLMPLEEEGRLNDDTLRENFIERVFLYDDWCQLREQGLTAQRLIDFHSRHKFQLLAHCQKTYRQLGPLLSDLKSRPLEDIAEEYIHALMVAMKKRVSRGAHVNTLQHLAGFLREGLSVTDRALINEQIEAYLREEVPLIVPMTLLRGGMRKVPQPYLEKQGYLSPYPDDLGLRNRV
ncbi:MAG: YbgA family protein [Alcanivorax sp.]|uniref:YbgA family protein n=1 Tax=Alcanivorax sp. TaxID=1872427 RepID=UPI003DA6DFBF